MDYMFPTTKPVQGEKLSDERLKGAFMNIVVELAGLVRIISRKCGNAKE